MTLDKLEIARRQLGTALSLFLDNADPVSVHTLACAGCEIAEHLTKRAGGEPFSTHALATFPDMDVRELRRLQNQYWNAFKHATTRTGLDRADEELLRRFKDEVNDHTLFIGWHDYMRASGTLPVEAQVFQVWYFAKYPEGLAPNVDAELYRSVFPGLNEKGRVQQKAELGAVISKFRQHPLLLRDPRTDNRPLILFLT